MNVFNKRNALIGFLTLKVVKSRLRRNRLRRQAPKIALVSVLGIGAIVGIVAVLLKRRGEDDFARLSDEAESGLSEPLPAT